MKPKAKKKGGHPTRLTPKFINKVKKLAGLGMTQAQICTIMGVSATTMSLWKRARNDAETKFLKALKEGEAEGIRMRLERISKAAGKGNWAADAWTLERRYPDQFAKRENLRIGDPDGKPNNAPTVIAPTVVFVQPKKEDLTQGAIDVTGNAQPKQIPPMEGA